MDYETVIGVEIHAELDTASKMFCSCPVVDTTAADPNTAICPICLGLPGAMPSVNRKAVEYAILVGQALNCTINRKSYFDRKNYFYPDLPKGYQVSQNNFPIAESGSVETAAGDESCKVRVRRVHMEEDTARTQHGPGQCLIDFNRSGVPLLEIVSEPDIRSTEILLDYATKVRSILRRLGVNTGNMEKGVLRFEANVSIRKVGETELGTRTEIKNLNSFRSMVDSVSHEVQRQIELVDDGGRVIQETLGWDEKKGRVFPQRDKESAHDYRYFPEPDIPVVTLSEKFIAKVTDSMPELPDETRQRFLDNYGLSQYDAKLLTADGDTAAFFEQTLEIYGGAPKVVSNWICGELFRILKDTDQTIRSLPLTPERMSQVLSMIDNGDITSSTAKSVLLESMKSGRSPRSIVDDDGLSTMSADQVEAEIAAVVKANPGPMSEFHEGKHAALNWLLGQVMQRTKGKANAKLARQLLESAIKRVYNDESN